MDHLLYDPPPHDVLPEFFGFTSPELPAAEVPDDVLPEFFGLKSPELESKAQ